MGVHGLWKLLESTGKPINPETLEGRILAVDISIWLNQALKGVRDRDGNTIQNAHLLTLFHRLCKLLFFRIRPVFVFDGEAPLLKRQTLAIRRQRKDEMSQESKKTKEKMLTTFLKRHALKVALGDTSQEAVPSLPTVRRDEADDMFVLPALPAPLQRESRPVSPDEEEAPEWEEAAHPYNSWQEDMYEDPGAVDINSEQFSQLPPEMKHEILKEMKEFSKRRRTMYHTPPEKAGDFSQYQLAGLLQRRRLNQRLKGVEQEMSQQSSAGLELPQDSEHSVETRRLVSEDSSHYILIKGPQKSTTVPESQAADTSSGPLTNHGKSKGQPESLWPQITVESPEENRPSSSKPSLPGRGRPSDCQPPSPRTLQAIQAAMVDSSSEEDDPERRDAPGSPWGDMSPRTLLAVQTAMQEEDMVLTQPQKGQEVCRKLPEMGPCTSKELQHLNTAPALEQSNLFTDIHESFSACGGTVSSSEEEQDGGAGDTHVRSQKQLSKNVHIQEQEGGASLRALGAIQRGTNLAEEQRSCTEEEDVVECVGVHNKADLQGDGESVEKVMSTNTLAINTPSDTKGRTITLSDDESSEPQSTAQSPQPVSGLSERHDVISTIQTTSEDNPEKLRFPRNVPQGNGHGMKLGEKKGTQSPDGQEKSESESESESGESSTEENFIEVSEGEEEGAEPHPGESLLKRDAASSPVKRPEASSPVKPEDLIQKEKMDEAMMEVPEGQSRTSQNGEEKDVKGLSPPPPTNDWEHIDLAELRQLESSLEVEQNSLRGQQQQQERGAATVTGQMCQESQELLRLFGIPFLVAPMEAEAQCAALDRAELTHGTITDDSDIWLFGGRHVFKNFFSQNKYVEHYQLMDLKNQLGLDRFKLINLAYLLGSDYTEGIPGVGYVTGMEILNEFPGPTTEPLIQFSNWWSEAQENKKLVANPKDSKVKRKLRALKLQTGFPNPAVAQAYLQPAVDPSEASFSWGRPHLDLLKEFCHNRFGWSRKKTDEALQPVLKQLSSQQTQLRIDSFFRMEQQESQQIQSQRLRRAVTCMKRKEREEEQEEEEEDEDMKGTKKGRPGRSEQNREPMSCSVAFEGGFMGSEGTGANSGRLEEPVGMDCKSTAPTPKVKTQESVQKNCPQKAVLIDSSSSDSVRKDCKSTAPTPEKKVKTQESVQKNCPQKAVLIDSSSSDSVGKDCKSTVPTPEKKVKTQESVQKNCPQKAVLIDSSSSDSVGKDCKSTAPTPEKKVKTQESIQKHCPQKAVLIDSSSSDSDSESGWAVPMVTAQSVFNNKPQRKGRRGGRGKGRSGL
ncbi:DNA excision repair protein ERCC-5 isoform X2 [Clupea harengus]|uniref:DNA excision repair protein ERCC-5 isoform X2 n=1 Tax=Clupea harengus TaxID=7950 RepID=A0A8M1KAF0_CLUHA|nr:DNA excision repair protein ERCC-5 isoform X2 [Clupea harengus]